MERCFVKTAIVCCTLHVICPVKSEDTFQSVYPQYFKLGARHGCQQLYRHFMIKFGKMHVHSRGFLLTRVGFGNMSTNSVSKGTSGLANIYIYILHFLHVSE